MERSVIICGGPDIEARTRAYLRLLGRHRVSVASRIDEFSEAIVDIRGGLASKRLIPIWQENGCVVVSDGPVARTEHESLDLLNRGTLFIALPSLYDIRYQLILGTVAREAIGDLVSVRMVRLLPAQSPLWDSVTFTHGLDALAVLQALGGQVARIMAQEQALRRGRPDTLFAVGRFEGGGIFYLEISAACPHSYRSERVEVVGTDGIMEYDSDLSRPLRLMTAEGNTLHDAPFESALPRMLADYLRRMEDALAMDEYRDRAQAAVELLFQTMDSARSHEAR